jgi:hypothetical protein
MKNASRLIALALMFGAVGASSQALAATKHHHHRGHSAYARAIGGEEGGEAMPLTGHRDQAIRQCSGQMNKLVQKDWGVMQNTSFAACMTEHGETP